MVICIAGMHRSGTSMLAKLLHLCGVYLGRERDMVAATPHNADGHWENVEFMAINEGILNELGAGWDNPFVLGDRSNQSPSLDRFRTKASVLLEHFKGREPWGWKDPRNSLTLDFWQELLPELRVIICVRHPLDVAQSLRRRGLSSYSLAISLWNAYNQRVLNLVPADRRLVTHYDQFFPDASGELRRIADWLALSVSDETIAEASKSARPELRHSRLGSAEGVDFDVSPAVMSLYLAMCQEAGVSSTPLPTAGAAASTQPDPTVNAGRHPRIDGEAHFNDAAAVGRINISIYEAEALQREIDAREHTLRELRAALSRRDALIVELQNQLGRQTASSTEQSQELSRRGEADQQLQALMQEQGRELARTRDENQKLQLQAKEHAEVRPRLLQDVAERDGTIAGLKGQITELQAQLGRQTASLTEQSQELSRRGEADQQLQALMQEQGREVARSRDELGKLQRYVAERETADRDLRTEIEERSTRIAALTEEVRRQTTSLGELRATLDERMAWVERLRSDVAARDVQIRTLEVSVRERTEWSARLAEDLARREASLRELQGTLEERDSWARRLLEVNTGREALTRELQMQLADRSAWALRTVESLLKPALRSSDRQGLWSPAPMESSSVAVSGPSLADLQKQLDEYAYHHREATDGVAQPDAAIEHLQKDLEAARVELEASRRSLVEADQIAEWLRTALAGEQQARERLERQRQENYKHLVTRLVKIVNDTLPSDASVAVVSKGDESLLKLEGRRAWHFPSADHGVYAGHNPADDAAAIEYLNAIRGEGAQFLVFPATSRWWLDHYKELRVHLEQQCRLLVDAEDTCTIFDLQPTGTKRAAVEQADHESEPSSQAAIPSQRPSAERAPWQDAVEAVIQEFEAKFGRKPVILDFHTNAGLAEALDQQEVFSPPTGDAKLPYLDHSIDIVFTLEDRRRIREARRVADAVTGVLAPEVSVGANGDQRRHASLRTEWRQNGHPPTPTISIIIPCHNGVSFTEACLSAVHATLPPSFRGELIVIDDASSDATAGRLKHWAKQEPRLRVLRNRTNLGFLRSCNRAAKTAKGEVLVFLNNDTVAWPNWLTALLRVFQTYPDAGAVGGKLVLPDGTLQEAGSIVFNDGSAANFGRGEKALDAPLYNYVREVDYCSGALLATPRELFNQLGGFDARYSPAYYEDVDYCFRVRSKGRRVYYQPASIVTHHEGASCGTDTSRGIKRYQVLNRAKFVRRWKAALAEQPARPAYDDHLAWKTLALRGSRNSGAAR
jgi:GT2 family glycosyltransferase